MVLGYGAGRGSGVRLRSGSRQQCYSMLRRSMKQSMALTQWHFITVAVMAARAHSGRVDPQRGTKALEAQD